VVLVMFISTEISITGTEASGLVSEVGLLTEVGPLCSHLPYVSGESI
jgi:hypothetical protein